MVYFIKEIDMFNFNYYTPTKVVFGKDTELKVAELIKEFEGNVEGIQRVLEAR